MTSKKKVVKGWINVDGDVPVLNENGGGNFLIYNHQVRPQKHAHKSIPCTITYEI